MGEAKRREKAGDTTWKRKLDDGELSWREKDRALTAKGHEARPMTQALKSKAKRHAIG